MTQPVASTILATVLGLVLSMTGASVMAALPLNPDNPGLSAAQRHAEIRKLADFWAEVDAMVDRSQTSPEMLGRKLGSIEAAFEWVRDHTRPVPYEGVLRGAHGVLQDRQGNSLDRSLLLAAMLTAQGREIRLVRGVLKDQTHLQALEEAWQRPFDAHEGQAFHLDQAIQNAMSEQGIDAAPDSKVQAFLAEKQQLEADWQAVQMQVTQRLGEVIGSDINFPQFNVQPDPQSWRDHWWTEVNDEGTWLSLDPARADNTPGQTLTGADQSFTVEEIPTELKHALDISVVATVSEANEQSQHVLVETRVYPYQLNTPVVSVTMAPISGSVIDRIRDARSSLNPQASLIDQLMDIDEWLPVITVDDYTVVEKSIFSDGRIREDANDSPVGRAFESAIGALGGLSMSGRGRSEPERSWDALHLDLVRHTPGRQREVFRQTRFDRADESWRQPVMGAYGLSDEDLLVFGAIAHESRFYLDFFSPSPQWFLDQMLRTFLGNEDLLVAALTDPGFTFTRNMLDALPPIPNEIFEFLTLRSADLDFARHSAADRIGLLALHEGRLPLDRQTLRAYKTIDIISHQRAKRTQPSSARLPGLLMSVLEWQALQNDESVESAVGKLLDSPDMDQWVLLKTASDWRAQQPDDSKPAPWAFSRAWDQDRWVVTQWSDDMPAYSLATQWWEINPQDGDILARDLFGHGAATLTWTAPALQVPMLAASPAAEWIFWTGLVSAATFGTIGFHGCIEQNQNDACCFVQLGGGLVAGVALGYLIGKFTALSAIQSLGAGISFDAGSSRLDFCHWGDRHD